MFKKVFLFAGVMTAGLIVKAGIESSELYADFVKAEQARVNLTGMQLVTLSRLEKDGFPVDKVVSYEYYSDTGTYLIKLENQEICMGTSVLESPEAKGQCLTAAGIRTWHSSSDSD
jgi:hypothetical protein